MTKKFYREDSPLGNAVVYSEEAPENFTEITDPIEVKKEFTIGERKTVLLFITISELI